MAIIAASLFIDCFAEMLICGRNAYTGTADRIRQVLADRGVPGLRDLALFSVAIDTMLHGPELLNLTVKDVQLLNGTIRSLVEVARTRTPPVRCA